MFRKIMHVLFIVTFGLILSSCGGGSSSGGGGGGGGGGALTVTMTSPSNGATNVSRTTTIQLSTSLSVTTVPSGSVVLQQVGGGVVSSSITAGGTSITISPSSTLNANTQYQVLVNNQLVSTSGVAVTPVTFTFTTGSDSSFTVSIASPGNLASVSPIQSTIVLQAGSPFLSAANVLANVQLETLDGTQITLPTPVLSSNNEIATFTLTDRLASSSTYTLTVIGGPSGIQSSTGTTIIGNEVSIFNTNALAIAFGTLALNADLAVSGDGINWVVDMLAMSVQQIMVSGSNVLMLGNQGAASSPSASLFSSFNMQRFYASTTANVINEYATDGGSVIVGVGGTAGTGNITYSTNNGVSWQEIILGANPLMEVAYGGGRFVALDNAGNAFFSTNGFVWSTSTATGLTAAATAPVLSYANGRFVAVTNAATGLNFSSPDGVTWTAGTATAVGASSIMFGTIAGTNYWVIGEVTGAIAYQSVAANAEPTGA